MWNRNWKPSDSAEISALVDSLMAGHRKQVVRTTFVCEIGGAWIDYYRDLFDKGERDSATLNDKPADLMVTGIVVDLSKGSVTVDIAIMER